MIKSLLTLLLASLACLSLSNANASNFERGINYDPVHSVAFSHGMGADQPALMRQAITADLNKLKEIQEKHGFRIKHLKTFYTEFQTLNAGYKVNIADVVAQWNEANPDYAVKLALGIYEFRPGVDSCKRESECIAWTNEQVEAAKRSLLKYNGPGMSPLIDRIIVGNEDLSSPNLPTRITADIKTLKKIIQDNAIKGVTIGTAQTTPDTTKIYAGTDYQDVLSAADFIGVNVYPFWGGANYNYNGKNAKQFFTQYWDSIKSSKNWGIKPLIETEEGWPTAGNPRASKNAAYDYFYYWYNGHNTNGETAAPEKDTTVPVSYLFALNDKLPGQGVESHWGLFSADNSSTIFDAEGKKFASSITFPIFKNEIGVDDYNGSINLSNAKPVIITACTEDNGQGKCYPLYGYQGSGKIKPIESYYTPSTNNQLMIDTSLKYYKSLFIILDDGKNYPGVCKINSNVLKSLNSNSTISIKWPQNGVPGACKIN
jgi:exo-beta-1,3-glucanase (GH17 family)